MRRSRLSDRSKQIKSLVESANREPDHVKQRSRANSNLQIPNGHSSDELSGADYSSGSDDNYVPEEEANDSDALGMESDNDQVNAELWNTDVIVHMPMESGNQHHEHEPSSSEFNDPDAVSIEPHSTRHNSEPLPQDVNVDAMHLEPDVNPLNGDPLNLELSASFVPMEPDNNYLKGDALNPDLTAHNVLREPQNNPINVEPLSQDVNVIHLESDINQLYGEPLISELNASSVPMEPENNYLNGDSLNPDLNAHNVLREPQNNPFNGEPLSQNVNVDVMHSVPDFIQLNGAPLNPELNINFIPMEPQNNQLNGERLSVDLVAETVSTEPGARSRYESAPKQKIFPPKENKSRKRPRDPENWKKIKAAKARELGEAYTSYKNKPVAAKTHQEGLLCPENCRLKCSDLFGHEERKEILKAYYSLDINSKNALLFQSIQTMPVGRHRKEAHTHKTSSFKYHITYNSKTNTVCKRALCALFQIGRKKIEIIKKKILSGVSAPQADRRGKHDNRPHKLKPEVVQKIEEHIASFPSEVSHYSRNKNPNKKYLSPILNLTKMFEFYIETCKDQNLPSDFFVKRSSYAKIFQTKFNLSFGQPKSDTCAVCDAGEGNDEHKENYHWAIQSMQVDKDIAKTSHDILFLTMDLQQTMPLPKLTTSKVFYLRQLWFYNLGLHVIYKKNRREIDGRTESERNISNTHKRDKLEYEDRAVFLNWTEDVANRGSVEICSALLRFVETDESAKQSKHLIIWTDSCSGQNKNFQIICLYQYFILKGYFKTIDHKFPEVGHTYLDSDRDFGRIEKRLRKHEVISVPEQYREIISKSAKNNKVIDMTSHFRKMETLSEKLGLIKRTKDELKQNVRFRDGIRWIRVEEYGSYLYKENYDVNTPFKRVNIQRNLRRMERPDNVEIERFTEKHGEVAVEKMENLKVQVKFVKPEYRYFYEDIINA